LEPKWYAGPDSGEDPLGKLAGHAIWFFNQVKDKGPWDYKYRDPAVNEGKRSKYEALETSTTVRRAQPLALARGNSCDWQVTIKLTKPMQKEETPDLCAASLESVEERHTGMSVVIKIRFKAELTIIVGNLS
jgi:hypothetical protein